MFQIINLTAAADKYNKRSIIHALAHLREMRDWESTHMIFHRGTKITLSNNHQAQLRFWKTCTSYSETCTASLKLRCHEICLLYAIYSALKTKKSAKCKFLNVLILKNLTFCLKRWWHFFITFFHIYSTLVTKIFIRLSSYLVLANLELVNDDVCFLMRITADLSSGGKSKLCERNMTAPPPS